MHGRSYRRTSARWLATALEQRWTISKPKMGRRSAPACKPTSLTGLRNLNSSQRNLDLIGQRFIAWGSNSAKDSNKSLVQATGCHITSRARTPGATLKNAQKFPVTPNRGVGGFLGTQPAGVPGGCGGAERRIRACYVGRVRQPSHSRCQDIALQTYLRELSAQSSHGRPARSPTDSEWRQLPRKSARNNTQPAGNITSQYPPRPPQQ